MHLINARNTEHIKAFFIQIYFPEKLKAAVKKTITFPGL